VKEPIFLTLGEVNYLHAESLRRFGGSDGVRDVGQVEAAIGAATNPWFYGGGDVFEIASAYAYHIAEAQAFLDGNKRTAAAAAIVFLARNGGPVLEDDGSIYQAMINIANHKLDKAGLAEIFRKLAQK